MATEITKRNRGFPRLSHATPTSIRRLKVEYLGYIFFAAHSISVSSFRFPWYGGELRQSHDLYSRVRRNDRLRSSKVDDFGSN